LIKRHAEKESGAAAFKKRHADQERDRVKNMSPEEAAALKNRHAEQESDRVK
jgi:hypothetical protein